MNRRRALTSLMVRPVWAAQRYCHSPARISLQVQLVRSAVIKGARSVGRRLCGVQVRALSY